MDEPSQTKRWFFEPSPTQAVANMRSDTAKDNRDPITVTRKEARRLGGWSRTTQWKLEKAGLLKLIRLPGTDLDLVVYSSLLELLNPDAGMPLRRRAGRP